MDRRDLIITAITRDKRKPTRVVVKSGTKRIATIDTRELDRLGLSIGQAVTEKLAAALAEAELAAMGRAYAARLLAKRAMSRAQVEAKLGSRGLAKATIARLADEFEKAGVLNDRALAESVVAAETRSRPAGRPLLMEKLARRGIRGAAAERAVDDAIGDSRRDQRSRAMELARGEVGRGRGAKDDVKLRRRVYALLVRRGFDEETAAAAVEGVMGVGEE